MHNLHSLFRSLGTIFGSPLLAVSDALGVEDTTNNVVANSREILNATATNHNDRVLLKIVALSRNVADHFITVRQPYLGNFAQRRIRFFGRRRVDTRANAPLLRAGLHVPRLLAIDPFHTWPTDELLDSRHQLAHSCRERHATNQRAELPTWAPSQNQRNKRPS